MDRHPNTCPEDVIDIATFLLRTSEVRFNWTALDSSNEHKNDYKQRSAGLSVSCPATNITLH